MKVFDRVAIVCDHTMAEEAGALRAILEMYRLRVDLYRVVQGRNVVDFFGTAASQYESTIICAHGVGDGADMCIRLEAADQKDGDVNAETGWEAVNYDLTPDRISTLVKARGGMLVTTACGGGREPLARAFLEAGYDDYVGSRNMAIEMDAALVFVVNFFYHLLAGDRAGGLAGPAPRDAVSLAAATDPDSQHGPGEMVHYARHVPAV